MERWPELRYADWKDTLQTLHMWTQIVGKIRLKLEPLQNHYWNVTFYLMPRGLTTSPMPYGDGRSFAIDFDFVDHRLRIHDCDGAKSGFALEQMAVADFYRKTMQELQRLHISVKINEKPNEVAEATPFDADTIHASYDRASVERFWAALLQANRLCKQFRAAFLGKASPVHFFWGSFDLAVTRFSGRLAPRHPGGIPNLPDYVTQESYSHEEFSCGFWPGGPSVDASFYAYAYPEPPRLSDAAVKPEFAGWNAALREFLMPYESVRASSDPDAAVLDFFQSTYDAVADLADWDRAALER